MSIEPSLEEQELLAESYERRSCKMTRGEVLAEVLLTACFVAVVAVLAIVRPPHAFAVGPALACLTVLIAAMLVRIDTPFGYTVPTQLAFVPLLFVVPLTLVPEFVVFAAVVTVLPNIARGDLRASRLLMMPCNAWFSVGPVAVFVIAGVRPGSAGPGLLATALAAQFMTDIAALALRELIAGEANLAAQLRQTWIYVVDAAFTGVGLLVAREVRSSPAAVLTLLPLLGVMAVFARERHQRLTGLLELNNAYHGTALVLGDVVEADDGYTGEHCRSVLQLVMDVAVELGVRAEQRRNLEFGALLHDVGKIAIPKEIINKPGKLDPQEWKIIQTHTLEGQRMLDRVGGFMRDIGLIVRSHHERWDGGGYPDGLAGEAIPLESRIIACCDTWNAMRTDRSYRKALSHEVALAELEANSGTQFDPGVVAALVRVVAREEQRKRAPRAASDPALAAVGATAIAAGSSSPAGTLAGGTKVASSLAG